MFYNSIHNLPILNYYRITEGGSLEDNGVKSSDDWAKIEEEYFNDFGFGDRYFNILLLRIQIGKLKGKYYGGGDKSLKTLINVKEAELKRYNKGDTAKGGSLTTTCASLSKFMGFRIDPKEVTVAEFYGYLKLVDNGTKNKK